MTKSISQRIPNVIKRHEISMPSLELVLYNEITREISASRVPCCTSLRNQAEGNEVELDRQKGAKNDKLTPLKPTFSKLRDVEVGISGQVPVYSLPLEKFIMCDSVAQERVVEKECARIAQVSRVTANAPPSVAWPDDGDIAQ